MPHNQPRTPTESRTLDPAMRALVGRYDHVTGLPNRRQFVEHLDELAQLQTPNLLMLITLTDARQYNEMLRALGIAFCEDLVRAALTRLQRLVEPDQTVFHVSLLSFALTLPVDDPRAIPPLAQEIATAFGDTLTIDAIPVRIHVGVGLLPYNPQTAPAEALRAVLVAAQDSRLIASHVAFYDHKTDAAHLRAFRILADLPRAIASDDQLSLHYQPRINLQTDRCHAVEALLRWNHPELGPISPAEFVPLAEQTALITPLTDWVTQRAMAQNRLFRDAGHALRVSINASPANLSELGFHDVLLHRCDMAGLDPDHIELEFTEGMLATNTGRAIAQLDHLRTAGVDVALDDFGSGYSNLSNLSNIPADVLKIDQSLVRPLVQAGDDDFLLRQVLAIAQGMGFRVCAEGIESAYAFAHLRELGCQEGQGYFMARPMPADRLLDWLDARH
ncbi:putative bifunctional diguanylate cyclase/phosphodiesterase [Devosia aquimaris]|uniref:putative bifunctional diguanylate cyclase/phosphodiesterase n=1 Tax=Devosia aquimaris TaxID=2866214 RepID=UPI001CD16DBF|nr:GGDEF domain-containing phosphodiesterase [Devosia sp. CJK-A8-3]